MNFLKPVVHSCSKKHCLSYAQWHIEEWAGLVTCGGCGRCMALYYLKEGEVRTQVSPEYRSVAGQVRTLVRAHCGLKPTPPVAKRELRQSWR